MTDLLTLADRVEAGEDVIYDLCAEIAKELLHSEFTRDHIVGPEWLYQYADKSWGPMRRFTESLDAAQALHDAVLPGWLIDINFTKTESTVEVYKSNVHEDGYTYCFIVSGIGKAPTPAAAWVAAILRAKHLIE